MKKSNYLRLITILVITIFLFTCSPNEPEKKSQMLVQPNSLTFTKNVTSEKLIISNTGEGTLSWQITDKPDWIEISKSSGKVTTGEDTVIITTDVNQNAGTYSGIININSNGGNKDVTVTLDISIWTKMTDMPTARYGLSACVVDGKIYAIGGITRENREALSTVEVFDPATDSWTTKTPLPSARYLHCAAVVNGIIYVFGGDDGYRNSVLKTEAYDPNTDTWTRKTDIPTGRGAQKCAVVNGKIYIIGGADGPPWIGLNVVEEYDPATDTWASKADMQFGRWGFAVSVVDGIIYAIGGQSSGGSWSSIVEAYDPSIDTWTRKNSMPTGRTHLSCSTVNRIIYVIGGGKGPDDPPLSTNEAYDPLSDMWTVKTDMPTARYDYGIGAVNGKIYVIGGVQSYPDGLGLGTVEEYEPGLDNSSR